MKPVTNATLLPKFLVVNNYPETQSWNKYLPTPWKSGEMVKVHSEQTSISKFTLDKFKKQFVRIIRKDANGNWENVCTESWNCFELLTNLKTIKK